MRGSWRIVRGAVAISVAVTLLRLTGERLHWSSAWFSAETGGIQPSGWTWVVGITWLPLLFGPWFARSLRRSGQPPPSWSRVLAPGLVGLILGVGSIRLLLPLLGLGFPHALIVVWLGMAAGAALQALGWLPLLRALLLYGALSRGFVALVMLLAMAGDWGTHYDYVGMPSEFQMPLLPKFLWLALFPQLVFWVAFTVILGSIGAGFYLLAAGFPGRSAGA